MTFTVSSKELYEKTVLLSPTISPVPLTAGLDHFLIEIEDGNLRLTASDLYTFSYSEISVRAKKNVRIVVPAKLLIETLKNLSGEELSFEVNSDRYILTVRTDFAYYKLKGIDPIEYPELPTINVEGSYRFSASFLSKIFNKVSYMVDTRISSLGLRGVLFKIERDEVFYIAASNSGLICCKHPIKKENIIEGGEIKDKILPLKSLHLLDHIIKTEKHDEVKITIDRNFFKAQVGSCCMYSSLIKSVYPDYESVIPKENKLYVYFDREEMIEMLARLLPYINGNLRPFVFFTIENNVIVAVAGEENVAEERFPCTYGGKKISIYFNPVLLRNCLKKIEGLEVEMKIKSDESGKNAVLFFSKEKDKTDYKNSHLSLLMPIIPNTTKG